MALYHVKIVGRDHQAMADLVRRYKVGVARHTLEDHVGGYRIDAHANSAQIRALQAAGYGVERHEDADRTGKLRQAEVGRVGRRAAVEARAVAAAAHYLNVAEVEAALAATAAASGGFTSLIPLPNQTWERRTCHALRIGHGTGTGRPGIYLLGGVHAREWGSPDILINFVHSLTEAYRSSADVAIGGNVFTAALVRQMIDTKDIYLFPQANPDGRNHSMTKEAMWRKNRRPAPPGHRQARCVGVDVNRNFDFLWNFPKYFDPASPIVNSTDPCDHDVYIGPSPASEPETKNAVWMLDTHRNIRYFVDLHSYSEDILYTWGDDVDQTTDPAMNFRNPAFDGRRGIAGDTVYREYIDPADRSAAVALANVMRDAIKGVRGRVYKVEQSMGLYPTAGASDDYAYSRHIVDPSLPKVFSYTVEWGSAENPTPFHPPYSEMRQIIQEISSALFAFCLAAA